MLISLTKAMFDVAAELEELARSHEEYPDEMGYDADYSPDQHKARAGAYRHAASKIRSAIDQVALLEQEGSA